MEIQLAILIFFFVQTNCLKPVASELAASDLSVPDKYCYSGTEFSLLYRHFQLAC